MRHVALILQKHVKDPRIQSITITGAKISDDLRQARIYYALTTGDQAAIQKGLDSAAGFIHLEVMHTLEMKNVPRIVFTYDESIAEGARIEQLFTHLHAAEQQQ